jgi:hypothetical protein
MQMKTKHIPGTEQNLAAAALEETLPQAQFKFRFLEWSNGRGTTGKQFDRLALLFHSRQNVLNLINE